jgi:hypothetical protein
VTLVVACGLKREERIIGRPGRDIFVVVGGGVADQLEADLDGQAELFPGIVMSAGIAGALDPTLRCGDVVIDGHPDLVAKLHSAMPRARHGAVAGSDTIIATVAQKKAMAATTGAIAVDMETHIARRVAERKDLPFVALRVISDDAASSLPPAALVGMRPDGGMALGPVLWSLARKPGQLRALIRTGNQASRAFKSLDLAFSDIVAAGFDRMELAALPRD